MRLLQLPAGAALMARLRRPGARRPPQPAAPPPPPEPARDTAPAPRAGPASAWTAGRVEIQGELWGPGHLAPGGAAEVLRYAMPIGLTPAATLLLLGAGAGGPPLSLATGLGVWVSAFEPDPVLLAMSRPLVKREQNPLARRVTLAGWDPAQASLPAHGFHHALLIEHIRDGVAATALDLVANALKPRGQLVLVETVAEATGEAAGEDAELAAWRRLEGRAPGLPEAAAITLGLSRLGFDIRVQEDMTARQIKLAMRGWNAMLRALAADRPDRRRAAAVIAEAELWMRRIRLMSEGRLRLMRWHAIKTR